MSSHFTGTYQPLASQGCVDLGFNSARSVEILSNQAGVIIRSGDSPEADFPVSTYAPPSQTAPGTPIFNEFPYVVIGGYQNNNHAFKFAEGTIDVLANPNPNADSVLNGQIDLALTGNVLEIDSTVNPDGQTPAPKATCLLQRI